ncbi:hypothetical protein EAG_08967 [Camponotus floridanus]|uniref:Uncharacterized protein n=1 Tax=Camponotus floridanus TaxID=104421 RepID=E2AUM6_CAMFO|nr:hypothetical protein EAG_08967 [Camponotus floridanus]
MFPGRITISMSSNAFIDSKAVEQRHITFVVKPKLPDYNCTSNEKVEFIKSMKKRVETRESNDDYIRSTFRNGARKRKVNVYAGKESKLTACYQARILCERPSTAAMTPNSQSLSSVPGLDRLSATRIGIRQTCLPARLPLQESIAREYHDIMKMHYLIK